MGCEAMLKGKASSSRKSTVKSSIWTALRLTAQQPSASSSQTCARRVQKLTGLQSKKRNGNRPTRASRPHRRQDGSHGRPDFRAVKTPGTFSGDSGDGLETTRNHNAIDYRTETTSGSDEKARRNARLWDGAIPAVRSIGRRAHYSNPLRMVEKRAIPAPSGTYIAAAERRSLTAIGRTAVAFGKKLFSPSKPSLRETGVAATVQAAFRILADNARAEEQRRPRPPASPRSRPLRFSLGKAELTVAKPLSKTHTMEHVRCT